MIIFTLMLLFIRRKSGWSLGICKKGKLSRISRSTRQSLSHCLFLCLKRSIFLTMDLELPPKYWKWYRLTNKITSYPGRPWERIWHRHESNVLNKGDCVLTRWMRGRQLVPFLLPGVTEAEFEYNTPARGISIALSHPAPIFFQIHFHLLTINLSEFI
jgi:hypothetical protein